MTEVNPVCQTYCEHGDAIEHVKKNMPPEEALIDLAEVFKILGDHTRMRILQALSLHELCVCDLAALLGMTQSSISHQLRYLRTAKLVRYRKEGKNVFYSLDDEHVKGLLALGLEHVQESR